MSDEIIEYAEDIGETTAISWSGPENMSYEQWAAIGRTLQVVNRSVNWWLGDWLAHGARAYGEMYAQAIEISDSSVETLKKLKSVAERIPPYERQESLSWTHHFAVSYLPQEQRGPILEIAARFELSTRDLKILVGLNPDIRARVIEAAQGLTVGNERHLMGLIADMRLKAADGRDPGARPEPLDEDAPPDEDDLPFADPLDQFSVPTDTVQRFWNAAGYPIKRVEAHEATWAGIGVKADIDDLGNPILVWSVL